MLQPLSSNHISQKEAENTHPHLLCVCGQLMASYKKQAIKGRLYELFASLFTVEDTEIIPCAHGEAHQAETEIIVSEFMVWIQDGCEFIGRTGLTHERRVVCVLLH